ncbi:M48 family metalloprotease [Halopseudomonas pachastrellae]|nr:M48 family metalloprotease [Halopseudomonas pachastrellae]
MAHGQYPERTLKVHFRSAPALGANAFALPGGHLVFTDAMVELAQHDDELVAVLAHEAGTRSIVTACAIWCRARCWCLSWPR